jgi:hypothetical protein
MELLGRGALRKGKGDWRTSERILSRYAEAMNSRFARMGSSKRAVVDAAVENWSGIKNPTGFGTRAEPWVNKAAGKPTADTARIEFTVVSTAIKGHPVVAAVDISYDYRKAFEWNRYTKSFGMDVPIADIRMSKNLFDRSAPIKNYVEWRRGNQVMSHKDYGTKGLPEGWVPRKRPMS